MKIKSWQKNNHIQNKCTKMFSISTSINPATKQTSHIIKGQWYVLFLLLYLHMYVCFYYFIYICMVTIYTKLTLNRPVTSIMAHRYNCKQLHGYSIAQMASSRVLINLYSFQPYNIIMVFFHPQPGNYQLQPGPYQPQSTSMLRLITTHINSMEMYLKQA